jgi:hypothetical protein
VGNEEKILRKTKSNLTALRNNVNRQIEEVDKELEKFTSSNAGKQRRNLKKQRTAHFDNETWRKPITK